jgi:diguanylate cyclase (GGDEF)-like protein
MLFRSRPPKPSLALVKANSGKPSDRPSERDSGGPPRTPQDELERALDAVAAVIRGFGRHAFDLPEADAAEIAHLCEKWATHLLLLAPSPTNEIEEDRSPRAPSKARDWVSAVQYVVGLRKKEHVYIIKTLQDLRDTIWTFVHGLNQAFAHGSDADSRMKTQLARLRNAAQGGSTSDLKREAISVAETIGTIVEERTKKQADHVMKLGERMAELGRALEQARREVAFDSLTKLFNRKTFDEELTRTADLGGLFKQKACLLIIDIDHFKAVNDTYGHPTGDEVLRKIAECLIRTFRRRDDVVARYGGEEFAVILRETVEKEAVFLSERLLEAARHLLVEHAGRTAQVTLSVGIAEIAPSELPESWLARADRALYDAKKGGRDRYIIAVAPESTG